MPESEVGSAGTGGTGSLSDEASGLLGQLAIGRRLRSCGLKHRNGSNTSG